jgi:predicted transcriptional regulator
MSAMERPGTNTFTTYLEEKQRWEKQRQASPARGSTALSLLGVLAQTSDGSMPLTDLQAASDMSFSDFAEAMKRLQDSGYLTIAGTPGSESAQLTKLGAEVGSLARPA